MKKFKIICITAITIMLCLCTFFGCTSEVISAYDIAVQNGFKGTQEQWLSSLKGINGTDGEDGIDGIDGINGKRGDSVSIEDIYDKAVQSGFNGTYLDFLREYLSLGDATTDITYATNIGLLSTVSVHAFFEIASQLGDASITDESQGAGIIYQLSNEKKDAYIITNYHVVFSSESSNASKISDDIYVYLYGCPEIDGNEIPATYVGGSVTYDIAVLKVENSATLAASDAREVVWADSNDVSVGQTAIAIGYPEAEGISATIGTISVDSEYIRLAIDVVNVRNHRSIRIDCAINPGNSGGGLYNSSGELIGVVNAGSTVSDGMNYAIPSSIAKHVTENIIYYSTPTNTQVKRCLMGITTNATNSRAVYDETRLVTRIAENVFIEKIEETSIAKGKLQVNDVLVSASLTHADSDAVETMAITRHFHLNEFLLSARVGDSVTIYFEREGVSMNTTLTFTESTLTVVE